MHRISSDLQTKLSGGEPGLSVLNLADVESVHKSSLRNFILVLSLCFVWVCSLTSVKNLASLNPSAMSRQAGSLTALP